MTFQPTIPGIVPVPRRPVTLETAFSGARFRVVLIDPPWRYQNWTDKKNGAAVSHYSTLKVDEMAHFAVPQVAAENSALLLWTPAPKLDEGLWLIQAWGFRFKTALFTWMKTYRDGSPYMGLGFYTRSGSELCLLGIRGSVRRRSKSVR